MSKTEQFNLNTHDLLKLIAILAMITDHVGMYFLPQYTLLRVLGRLAAPIFFFLIGYTGSTRLNRELWLYAFILLFSYWLLSSRVYLNILFNIIWIRIFFRYTDPVAWSRAQLFIFSAIVICLDNTILTHYVEYGANGIMIAVAARYLATRSQYGVLLCFLALGHYFLSEQAIFHFQNIPEYALIHALLLTCLTISLLLYRNRSLRYTPNILKYCARHSLQIYFAHVICFQSIIVFQAFQQYAP